MKSIINQLRNNLRYGVKSKVQEQRIYSELDVQVFAQLHRRVYDDVASRINNNLSNQINSNIKL